MTTIFDINEKPNTCYFLMILINSLFLLFEIIERKNQIRNQNSQTCPITIENRRVETPGGTSTVAAGLSTLLSVFSFCRGCCVDELLLLLLLLLVTIWLLLERTSPAACCCCNPVAVVEVLVLLFVALVVVVVVVRCWVFAVVALVVEVAVVDNVSFPAVGDGRCSSECDIRWLLWWDDDNASSAHNVVLRQPYYNTKYFLAKKQNNEPSNPSFFFFTCYCKNNINQLLPSFEELKSYQGCFGIMSWNVLDLLMDKRS